MSYVDKDELRAIIDYLMILYAITYQHEPSSAPALQNLIRRLIRQL